MKQSSMPMRAWIAGLGFFIWTAALTAQEPALVVNGKPIVTSPPPTRIGNDIFLPIVPIARALGADVSIGQDQSVSVRRADGATVIYDSRTGEIRSGNVMIGQVKDYRLIRIVPDMSGLLFPLSALVPMFDISVRRDDENKLLYLDSAPSGGQPQNTTRGFSLADLGYNYGLTTNGNVFGQTFNVNGQALAGATTLTSFLQLTRVPNGPALYLNQASVRADFSSRRSLVLGDQGIYSGIDVLTNSMRGVGYEQKLGGFTASLYGGRAIGSLISSFGSSIPHYDTTLTGISFRRTTMNSMFSVGLNAFRNQQRRGATAGIAYSLRSAWNQANVQLAAGEFSGMSLHTVPLLHNPLNPVLGSGTPLEGVLAPIIETTPRSFIAVRGPAYGVTVSDAFTPIRQISISGQWDYYSRNFLTAREDSRYNGASGVTGSISIRPIRPLTLNASAGDRHFLLGDSRRTRNYSLGANLLLPGRRSPQLGYIRTIQTDASVGGGRFQLSQYSVTLPNWNRYSFYGYYSVTSLGKEKTANLNAVTGIDLSRHGRVDLHFQSQAGSHYRYGGDWYHKFGERDGYLRVGVDALSMKYGRAGVLPVVGVRLPLPKRQVVEVSYLRDISTQMLQVQFGGKIVTPHAITRDSRGMARMAAQTNLAGLVYIDVNYSGSFDSGDQPIADLKVWRDNEAMVVTDARGYYRFDSVEPGAHTIRAELAGVPAGYIFAGQGTQTLAAAPNRENRADFRVIKTGQVEGKVTYMDYVTDPEQPKESPFPDAHIVATGNRDSYSESNGTFLLGDLPPGRYELRIDPETIPKGYVSQPPSFSVEVTPGAITRDVKFRLVIPPKPVIEIRAPDQKIESPAPGGTEPRA